MLIKPRLVFFVVAMRGGQVLKIGHASQEPIAQSHIPF